MLFYCADYFHHHDGHTEKRLPSFAAELVAFSGAMFGLVISDNMLLLYVFWELTTVLSFLLVGHYAERATSRRAATQALMVTTAGGLAMLVGIVILGQQRRHLPAVRPGGPTRRRAPRSASAVVLVLIGALSKSAIVPFHFWLPGRDGRADPGQRLPARRRDGQGRRLPRRPADPRLRRRARLATGGRHPRLRDDDHRRLAGRPRVRPQAHPRVRHGQPARA